MERLKNPLTDHRNAVEYIESHGPTYTIIRPVGLTNDPFTGKYQVEKEAYQQIHIRFRAPMWHTLSLKL